MKTKFFKPAAVAAVTMTATTASAVTLQIEAANQTTLEVTADLAGLGLGGVPTGSATFDGTLFGFNITGGTLDSDTGAAVINHNGSGVQLFALADNSITADVGNFVIDTAASTVFGNVNGGTDFLALFDLDAATADGIPLLISDTLSGALNATFNGGNDLGLTGAKFGLANTNPSVAAVPLPASMALLGLGLAGLGVAGRRRKAA